MVRNAATATVGVCNGGGVVPVNFRIGLAKRYCNCCVRNFGWNVECNLLCMGVGVCVIHNFHMRFVCLHLSRARSFDMIGTFHKFIKRKQGKYVNVLLCYHHKSIFIESTCCKLPDFKTERKMNQYGSIEKLFTLPLYLYTSKIIYQILSFTYRTKSCQKLYIRM